jgi:transposase
VHDGRHAVRLGARHTNAALNTTIAEKETKLRDIKGIGPVSARILIAMLPKLGKVTRRQIASLAGLAPHPDQSGTSTKKRPMTGRRDLVRSTLFLAALSAAKHHPTLKLFYDNLIANLKPAKKALAAIARKLVTIANAILRPEKIPENALLRLT